MHTGWLSGMSTPTRVGCLAVGWSALTFLACSNDGSSADAAADASSEATNDSGPAICPSGKEPKDDPNCVTDALGVFVSPMGNDSNPGTKMSPVKTLGAALMKKGMKAFVFVCEGSYTESADVKIPVSINGGFKCNDWSYSGMKPKFGGAKSDYVIKVDGVSGSVQLVDLELDGKDGTMPGESSIALFANASTDVKLTRLRLEAGAGSQGADGTLTQFAFPDAGALTGNNASGSTGGAENSVTCPGGAMTVGGKGGNGTLNNSFNTGDSGLPALGGGLGGSGGATCTAGGDGTANGTSDAGVGGSSGALTGAGWSANAGSAGQSGGPGQGGGGGGGRDNGSQQGGGGGGGAGGCGGAGGSGGKGGGGSIAFACVSSTTVIASCVLISKSAGNGGKGSTGQGGQSPGGSGVNGVFPGCASGSGGAGGSGGSGGGGAGGISVGIVYKPTKPMYGADTMIMVGTKGTGGTSPAGGASNGVDGVAQPELMAP